MKTLRSFPATLFRLTLPALLGASLAVCVPGYAQTAAPSAAAASPVNAKALRDGWYAKLLSFEQMQTYVDIPPKKGVMLIDSRPAARQYDPGHIPGAVNIPDTQFDKLVDRLPADKATKLIFYCGGVECMLSHDSARKAEKLGYTDIHVYADGMPDWKAKGGHAAVSTAHVAKLLADKTPMTLIDARPKRVADKGMVPSAINVSDTDFDKNLDKLPADKSALLVYYCGGLECTLSENSASKARKLGYSNVVTYPGG
jgi:rhodanese-related sulfurtransferase